MKDKGASEVKKFWKSEEMMMVVKGRLPGEDSGAVEEDSELVLPIQT